MLAHVKHDDNTQSKQEEQGKIMYALVKRFGPFLFFHAGTNVQYKTHNADKGAGAGGTNQYGQHQPAFFALV
jgi:hypothetical protein